jgi:putative flippase GtrA
MGMQSTVSEQEDIFINTYPANFTPQFAMVMPVHNEESSVEAVVMDVYKELGNRKDITFEIILAEDGSKDRTKEVIMALSQKIPLKAILSYKKKGYSGGIKSGLDYVSAPNVIVSDSDGQHRPEDFWKLREKLEQLGYPKDMIISGNRMVRADASHRKVMSSTFQKLNGIAFDLPPLKDITCAFKLMDTNLARKIASECKYMKESFWTEFTIRCHHRKIHIVEVPVQHVNRLEGETVVYQKSKIPKIVKAQLKALMALKRELTGKSFVSAMLQTKSVKRLITFASVGASGAGIILFLTWLGVNLNLHYIASAAIAIEASILWAFFLNDRITFKDMTGNSKLGHRFLKYHGVALAGLGINLSVLYALTSAGLFYLVSEIVAIFVAFAFNFMASKKWAWRD